MLNEGDYITYYVIGLGMFIVLLILFLLIMFSRERKKGRELLEEMPEDVYYESIGVSDENLDMDLDLDFDLPIETTADRDQESSTFDQYEEQVTPVTPIDQTSKPLEIPKTTQPVEFKFKSRVQRVKDGEL